MNSQIPILMYHQVSTNIHPELADWAVTPKTFATHMKILKLFGYKTITLTDLYNHRMNNIETPKKSIIITFDDGYQEAIDYSVPVLQSSGFTAVYFIPTACIGKMSNWLMPEFGIQFPIIDEDTVLFLEDNGFQVGSHSMTHPYLTKLSAIDCYNELLGSRMALEDLLGHKIFHLAYPYGSYNDLVKSSTQQAGYAMAFTDHPSFTSYRDDPYLIPRINIGSREKLIDFIFILQTAAAFRPYLHRNILGLKRLIKRRLRNNSSNVQY